MKINPISLSSSTRVWFLYLAQRVRTDPLHVNPSLRIDLQRGGGLPTENTTLLTGAGLVTWDAKTGEVRGPK